MKNTNLGAQFSCWHFLITSIFKSLYYQNDTKFLTARHFTNSKNSTISVGYVLGKNISIFVSSDLKLHNRYCHNQGYCIIPFCIFFVNLYASLIICVSQIDLGFVIILQDIFWEYEFLGSSNLKIDYLCVVRHIFYALKNKLKLCNVNIFTKNYML